MRKRLDESRDLALLLMTEDFKTLFEEQYKGLDIKEGTVLKGTIVAIRRDSVMVDVGFKSEGLINAEEFRNFDGEVTVKPGDSVDVVLEHLEDPKGNMILSKERADALKSWDRVSQVFEGDETIDGVIVNKIKGGMSVNLGGIKAFLPGSQIDLKPVKSLDKLIGQKYRFKILKLNKAKGNIVLSRRVVLEDERQTQKVQLLENLREGQVVKGVVKNITDYGAFVDLGGVDGLLHITDLSWGRVGHPSEVINVGQEIEVVVLKYEAGSEKVSLGFKQLQADPWKDVEEKYSVGHRLKGKVVNIADYGVFVEIEPGIEGLVHVSELTWSKKVKHPSKMVKQGEEIETVILDINAENRRISLGVKQLGPNPWHHLEEKFPSGTRIHGVVRNVTDFGVFVGIEGEEIDGLVHISDLAWDKNINHPSEMFKKGDEVEVIVLSVDKTNERFALGIKQLADDPWDSSCKKYSIGKSVEGKITEIESKGVVVSLEGKFFGYIPDVDLSSEGKLDAKKTFKVGDSVTAMVKKHDDKNQRIMLSIKAQEKAEEKQALKEFKARQGDPTAKLKDAMK